MKNIPVELVKKAQEGDTQALEELLLKSVPLIGGATFRILKSEIEDIQQEVKIQIFKNLSGLREIEKYPAWVKRITRRKCINILKQKDPLILKLIIKEGDLEDKEKLDYIGIQKTSKEEFEKTQKIFEIDQRIGRIAGSLEKRSIELLKLYYIDGLTFEEMASLGGLGKSSYERIIEKAKAQWILEEANKDWEESNFDSAKTKLKIIVTDFKPDDGSKEKRHILASALSRLGDIHQVQGNILGTDNSIDFFHRSQEIWNGLRNKVLVTYARHMIALCNNIKGDYKKALGILNEIKNDYPIKTVQGRQSRGNLERDIGSIYLNLNENGLAKVHIDSSQKMLEDAGHLESYLAAIRKRGEVEIRLKQFKKAQNTLQESLKDLPRYRALPYLQTKIVLVKLCFILGDIPLGLQYASEAEERAKEFGFLHQLSILKKILIKQGQKTL